MSRNAIEDTKRLVTEIEMLKVALYLVSRRRSRNWKRLEYSIYLS
jgi:hypothetical protein